MTVEPPLSELAKKVAFLNHRADENKMILAAQHWGPALLFACSEFEELAYSEHSTYSELTENDLHDPRKFFTSRVLKDLIEGAFSLRRWTDLLKERSALSSKLAEQAILGSLNKDISALTRRLFEIGLHCRMFESASKRRDFEHFLLLHDSKQTLEEIKDKKEYFGIDSISLPPKFKSINGRIVTLEANFPELLNAWYLDNRYNQQTQFRNLNYFASTRTINAALQTFDDGARAVFGMTYSQLFGSASKDIHFSPSLIMDFPTSVIDLIRSMGRCVALGLYALTSISIILGVKKHRVETMFSDFLSSDAENVSRFIFGRQTVGDIVLVGEYPAEIMEITVSKYGYEIYRLEFFDKSPPQPYDTWYLSAHLFPYFSVEQQEQLITNWRTTVVEPLLQQVVDANETLGASSALASVKKDATTEGWSEDQYQQLVVKSEVFRRIFSQMVVKTCMEFQQKSESS